MLGLIADCFNINIIIIFMHSRHCQRFLPISGSCHANMADLQKLAEQMFQSTFFAEEAKPSTVREENYYYLVHSCLVQTLYGTYLSMPLSDWSTVRPTWQNAGEGREGILQWSRIPPRGINNTPGCFKIKLQWCGQCWPTVRADFFCLAF